MTQSRQRITLGQLLISTARGSEEVRVLTEEEKIDLAVNLQKSIGPKMEELRRKRIMDAHNSRDILVD